MAEQPTEIDWKQILKDAGPYLIQAFHFVREGLSYTAQHVHGDEGAMGDLQRHISGHNRELSIAATVFMGVNQAGFMTITHAIIQSIVPDEIRGRISGVYGVHVGGSMALANLTNGGLADLLNAPLVMAAGGIIFIVLITSSAGLPQLRRIYFPRAAASPSLA